MKKKIVLIGSIIFILAGYLPGKQQANERTPTDLILIPPPFVSSFGRSLAMGDVNGDGYDDLIIGSPEYNEFYAPVGGKVFVVYGRAVFADTFFVDLEAPGVSFLDGPGDSDFGCILCCADYNRDNYDDIIIGAPQTSMPDRPTVGKVFCINGKSDYLPALWDLKQNQADWTLIGKDSGNEFGRAIDVGDFNGDGKPDIIVGAPFAWWPDSAGVLSGCIFIIPGRDNYYSIEDMASPLITPFIICGVNINDYFGWAVKAYDINNNGFSDLLIGAYKANPFVRDEGEAYLIPGNENPSTVLLLSEQDANVKFKGGEYQEQLGYALHAGDFNGDDWGDVVLGSRQSRNGDIILAGRLRINLRAENLPNIVDFRINVPDVDVLGEKVGGKLGSVFAVGDVNADGYDDLVAGAPFSAGTQDTGRVYVFLGGSNLQSHWDLAQQSANVTIIGTESNDYFGGALTCGDLNGDGFDDVAIAAEGASPNGKVFVLFGSARTVIKEQREKFRCSFELAQNFPNPFNSRTTIRYQIPQYSHVVLSIFNLLGEPVMSLINENQAAGFYSFDWDGSDAYGRNISSGVYLYKIEVIDSKHKFVHTKKMILMK